MSVTNTSAAGQIPGADDFIEWTGAYLFPAPDAPEDRAVLVGHPGDYSMELDAERRADVCQELGIKRHARQHGLASTTVRRCLEHVTAVRNPVRLSLALAWFDRYREPGLAAIKAAELDPDDEDKAALARDYRVYQEAAQPVPCADDIRCLLHDEHGRPTPFHQSLLTLSNDNEANWAADVREANEAILRGKRRCVARRTRGLTLSGLRNLKPPAWLMEPYLLTGTVAQLTGPSGSYKSFLALDIALRLARTNRDVLYVAAEGLAGLGQRVSAWEVHNGSLAPGHAARMHFFDRSVNLLDGQSVTELCDWLPDAGTFRLIVLDTLARSIPGADENSAETMTAAVEAVDRIRRAAGPDCTILLVHHMGWDAKRQRGSSSLYAATDTVLYVKPVEGVEGRVKLEVAKQKDQPETKPVFISLVSVPGSESCVLIKADTQTPGDGLLAEIIEYLKAQPEGATPKAIAEGVGADYEAVKKAAQRASGDNGPLRRSGRGIYAVRRDQP